MRVTLQQRIPEAIAVACNLLFTFFYLRSNPVCFVFGVAGPILLIWPCMSQRLYGQVLLQLFYAAVSVYGYLSFGEEWRVESRSLIYHISWILAGIVFTAVSGYIIRKSTNSLWSYVDAGVMVFAMIGTWQMMNFIHENWLYLIVVNLVSIVLYSWRKLWLAAAMFVLYLAMSIDGYVDSISWFGS